MHLITPQMLRFPYKMWDRINFMFSHGGCGTREHVWHKRNEPIHQSEGNTWCWITSCIRGDTYLMEQKNHILTLRTAYLAWYLIFSLLEAIMLIKTHKTALGTENVLWCNPMVGQLQALFLRGRRLILPSLVSPEKWTLSTALKRLRLIYVF